MAVFNRIEQRLVLSTSYLLFSNLKVKGEWLPVMSKAGRVQRYLGRNGLQLAKQHFTGEVQETVLPVVYGEKWKIVETEYKKYGRDLSFLGDDTYPFLILLSEKFGVKAAEVVISLLRSKRTDAYLSRKISVKEDAVENLKAIRSILNKLYVSGMVSFKYLRPKKQSLYKIDRTAVKAVATKRREEIEERVHDYVEDEKKRVVRCDNCGNRLTLEQSYNMLFKCNKCGALMNIVEPPEYLEKLT